MAPLISSLSIETGESLLLAWRYQSWMGKKPSLIREDGTEVFGLGFSVEDLRLLMLIGDSQCS
jgi:hypothetical protein